MVNAKKSLVMVIALAMMFSVFAVFSAQNVNAASKVSTPKLHWSGYHKVEDEKGYDLKWSNMGKYETKIQIKTYKVYPNGKAKTDTRTFPKSTAVFYSMYSKNDPKSIKCRARFYNGKQKKWGSWSGWTKTVYKK